MIKIPTNTDLNTRVSLLEQIANQLTQAATRNEQDNHDRSAKDQEQLITLARVADSLSVLTREVITNRQTLDKNYGESANKIDEINQDFSRRLGELRLDVNKSTNFVSAARWSFTALWAFMTALVLELVASAIKHSLGVN